MKKALAIAFVLVFGLGIAAFAASPLSGSWETNLTFGFRDVSVNYPGQTITIPGQQLSVSRGTVTIPAETISWSFDSKTYTYTIPSETYWVGPWDVTVPGGTYNVTGDTVTLPDMTLQLNINDTTVNVPYSGGTYDVHPGSVDLTYGPITGVITDLTTGQTWSITVSDPSSPYHAEYTCGTCTADITLDALTVPVMVNGTLIENITVPAQDITVDCTATSTTVPARSGTGTHYKVDFPALTLVKGTDYTCNPPYVVVGSTNVPVTVSGITGTVTIPGGTYPVTGSTVTIPDKTITVPADSITIPAHTVSITVDGQRFSYTIPERTISVSGQTATLPDLQVVVAPWSQTITKIPTLSFTSTLIVDYTVGGWTFESTSKFADTGWTAQSFTAKGNLGAFTISSSLVFDPSGPSFTKWDTTSKVSIAGVDLSSEFLLGPAGSGWKFGASGVAGSLSLGATAYFNMTSSGDLVDANSHCFCFSSVEFTASAPFACIDKVSATLDFNTSGFDSIDFAVKGIAVPNISWLTFDANVSFATTSKSVTLTPNINLGKFSCITLYYDLLTSGTYQITGIDIYGLGLSYSWNGVSFVDKTSFDSAKNEDVTGEADYWELFQIKSSGDSCCGGAVAFSVSTYFKADSGQLFGWGETAASLSFGIGSNYTISSGLTINESGLKQLTAGFKVTW